MKEKNFNPYMGLPFASMTIIGANGVIDSIDCTTATPKETMEFFWEKPWKIQQEKKVSV